MNSEARSQKSVCVDKGRSQSKNNKFQHMQYNDYIRLISKPVKK